MELINALIFLHLISVTAGKKRGNDISLSPNRVREGSKAIPRESCEIFVFGSKGLLS
jgi:hypothetical protein